MAQGLPPCCPCTVSPRLHQQPLCLPRTSRSQSWRSRAMRDGSVYELACVLTQLVSIPPMRHKPQARGQLHVQEGNLYLIPWVLPSKGGSWVDSRSERKVRCKRTAISSPESQLLL